MGSIAGSQILTKEPLGRIMHPASQTERETAMKTLNVATGMVAIILILLHPAESFAQAVANAQIHGVITDSSDAVVPGAQIKATQTQTGQVRTTISTSDGSYVLSNLAIGPYTLEVTTPAFRNYLQSGIVLQVGNNVLVNVALQ